MSKDRFANDLELPPLFDTDEPLFMTHVDEAKAAPVLTPAELMAMGGTGDDTNHEGDGGGGGGGEGGGGGDIRRGF